MSGVAAPAPRAPETAGMRPGAPGAADSPGRPDTPETIRSTIFGQGATTLSQDHLKVFQSIFGNVNPDQANPQAAAQMAAKLGKMGLNVGNPPSLANAREGMIAALQAANMGDSRAELEKKSLPELMQMYAGLKPEQQSAGKLQMKGGESPTDSVESGPARRGPPGAQRNPRAHRAPGAARPAQPRHARSVRSRPDAQARIARARAEQARIQQQTTADRTALAPHMERFRAATTPEARRAALNEGFAALGNDQQRFGRALTAPDRALVQRFLTEPPAS